MATTWSYTSTTYPEGSWTGYFQTESNVAETLVSGSTFRVKTPRIRGAGASSRTDWSWGTSRLIKLGIRPSWYSTGRWSTYGLTNDTGVAQNEYCTWRTFTLSTVFNTADYFNENNPTERTVTIGNWEGARIELAYNGSGSNSTLIAPAYNDTNWDNRFTFASIQATLDVPPTFDTTDLSISTSSAYTNITTASVTVSNTTAYYGGTVESTTLTIGNQTATIAGDGTLSILLNAGGTFTPTVTVTDSRGQIATQTLDSITVNVYTAPSVSFTVERTTQTGKPEDEGSYATVDATFTFVDVIADAVAPTVTVTDEDGVQTTPTVTWYSSRATDGTLSGSVTWANLSSGDTVYGLIPNLNTEFSWQIVITPRDTEGTGTAISQTLAGAFYTIDFLAGGHGIAFGKPAINEGFECAIDATFEETLTAQDMTTQEIDDFVDSLVVGGGGTAVDLVVEQGTSGIWTYRKWSSGIAECWGTRPSISTGFTSWTNGWYYSHFSGVSLPFTFTETPIVTQHCSSSGGDIYAVGASIGNYGGLATTTNTGGTTLYRADSGTIAIVVRYYVVGRWK